MADVTLKNIKKVYDKKVVAVQNFNLEIADKEFIVLVGPSGCGKSTTLRMVAGLEDITDGELKIGGRTVNDVAPKDRDIAMVFQNYALYPHMTVYENMAFALKLRKLDRKEINRRVTEAARILDISELLERKPKALSGGQRQRVAIGRAIVREPQVFLMDEPLSNLDAKLRNQMRAQIIKLRERIDTTFIYVTHDQTEAMTLGDRIVIMKDGRIQQIGTPFEVYTSPANLFVAGFIGTPRMNFFNAELVEERGEYFARTHGARFSISDIPALMEKRGRLRPGPVSMGVRPEHILITHADENGSITARIEVAEMMGSEVHLHVSAGGDETIIRAPALEFSGGFQAKEVIGREISFTFHAGFVNLFDAETEQNLIN